MNLHYDPYSPGWWERRDAEMFVGPAPRRFWPSRTPWRDCLMFVLFIAVLVVLIAWAGGKVSV